eukprot:CAMPEP_0113845464 /NCGR_PEP_ID=MMETSP0372-20130328/772_1 /TAXON_ID=340204 /ORGANISM="Lankesteria abbotti" /LENGTH=355 /DNA_ID=CAMNT_0000814511 /DNA_START=33 /DNA_END=1097 /DNA_ORIENTATION=+ /assembly_acc=CAM_ASM_000359
MHLWLLIFPVVGSLAFSTQSQSSPFNENSLRDFALSLQPNTPDQSEASSVARQSQSFVNLSGKVAFIAGVSDANGFGWSIAKSLHRAGATIAVGTWVPMVARFETQLKSGALDADLLYDDGTGKLVIDRVLPLDVAFDTPEDIPDQIKSNRRFAPFIASGRGFTISEVAADLGQHYGHVDILIHAIANGPEVAKPLMSTSRKGYLAAQASSAYSLISLIQKLSPWMPRDEASVVSLTYIASQHVIPGYGGGMSSAKASLESDTRTLAYETGREFGFRVNTISAGPLKSRAASAIKKGKKTFIESAIAYNKANSALNRDLSASDVADTALFLTSQLARAITGVTLYVDNGMHTAGM